MSGRTVTRSQLSDAIFKEVGLSRSDCGAHLDSVLNMVTDALVRGENVKLASFGNFCIRSKGDRIGQNPKTGEEVPILSRKVLIFRPSPSMKAQINSKRTPGGS
ncbi:integration host factor subunit alpha [Magnetovibrio blakemorei]|uniref:integration host factor subunit alpha n=1 Tax=Magnetovibrio blakemorei TaxID=28181 RepID=UPI0009FFAE5D|nr:integration host factor subunit alpha [Magnetovibrio blakemorei]